MRLRSAEIVAIARHSLWYIKLKMYISSLKTAGRNTTKNEQQQERMRKEEEGETKTKTETNIKCWKWKLVLQVSLAPNDTIRTDPIRYDPIRIRSLRWDANAWFSRILSTFLFRVRMINNKSNAKMSVMYVACQRLRLFMAWINKNNAPIRDDKLTTKTKNNFEKKNIFVDGWECFSYEMGLSPSISLSLCLLILSLWHSKLELELKMFENVLGNVADDDGSVRLTIMNATPHVGPCLWWLLRSPRWWGKEIPNADAETALWRLIESWVKL